MFKIGSIFWDVSKISENRHIKYSLQRFVCLMTYQANLYFSELSLAFVRDMA